MRTDRLGGDLRWLEESQLGALFEFRAERARAGRSRIEMSNRLPQSGNNLGNRPNGLFRQVAVHIVPKSDLHAAVPEPADSYVDFAVVDLLKLDARPTSWDPRLTSEPINYPTTMRALDIRKYR
jgi:hypothetical protein